MVQVGSPPNDGGQYLENGIGTYVLTGKKSKKASFKHDTKVTKVLKKHGNVNTSAMCNANNVEPKDLFKLAIQ